MGTIILMLDVLALGLIHMMDVPITEDINYCMIIYVPIMFNADISTYGFVEYKLTNNEIAGYWDFLNNEFSIDELEKWLGEEQIKRGEIFAI